MSKSSRRRAQTRATRNHMDVTGENYTRAFTQLASGAGPVSAVAPAGDLVRHHIEQILRAEVAHRAALDRMVEQLEADGHRLIAAPKTINTGDWAVYDFRTDEVIAEGSGGFHGYMDAKWRLDPDGNWTDFNTIYELVEDQPVPATPGLPEGVAMALNEWIANLENPDEDIAIFIGWPVDQVARHRRPTSAVDAFNLGARPN